MKPIKDLNEYLDRLNAAHMIARITHEVDPKHELAALAYEFDKKRRGALVFDSVKGYNLRVVTNLYGELERACLVFGIRRDELHDLFLSAMNSRMGPALIEKGKVQEQEVASLDALPIPENTPHDAGRYITGILTTHASGVRVLQWVRAEVKSARKLVLRIDPGRRFWDVTKDKQKLDAALIIGAPPSVEFAAAVRGSSFDKLGMAGSLQGSKVDIVKCERVNCEVPALSQIVIEGELDKRNMEQEGPFAEFTGYYSPSEQMPVFHVAKVTMRSDAIYRTIIGASVEHLILNNVAREASILDSLKRAVPGIVDVHLPPSGCGFVAFLSIRREYVMMAKNALLAALSAHPIVKYAVVVDDDVNIEDEREVLWAIATRSAGDNNITIVHSAFGHTLDPASEGGFGNKVGIDATFPPENCKRFKRVEYISLGMNKSSS